MIRDRLKKAAKRVAVKMFDMESDVEARPERPAQPRPSGTFDPSVIPRIVDGDGDTPGPNHKTDIGTPYLGAQVASGAGFFLIDTREDVSGGGLPGAVHWPGEQLKRLVDRLPDKEVRVTVYDQDGEGVSGELAGWLRDQGWVMARRLRGGFDAWQKAGEPVVPLGGAG